MDEFLEDLKSGEIQMRDRFQFELKSDFYPRLDTLENLYTQEFYFFVPNGLQINQETFAKTDFYRNLTNYIRYKTPELSFKALVDPDCAASPLIQIPELVKNPDQHKAVQDELKLFGNIYKSALRKKVSQLIHQNEELHDEILVLCSDLKAVRAQFDRLKPLIENERTTYEYIDEFLSNTTDYYMTGMLNEFRKTDRRLSREADDAICHLILEEKYRISQKRSYKGTVEEILYRSGLLKKFVMDALSLSINRSSVQERFGGMIASFAAGLAMFVYLLLFVWQGSIFVINSIPFIVITVLAYVLKDRLKESLKSLSYQRAFYWFSDFETEIRSSDNTLILGVMKESFTFLKPEELPEEISGMRNRDFHTVLETFKRPEQILYFKRQVKMFSFLGENKGRLSALNILLRFNIQDFMEKAGDPAHDYLSLDQTTHALVKSVLPKVYHLNVILKNRFIDAQNQPVIEIKKFRLVVDKNGIRQIEHVH